MRKLLKNKKGQGMVEYGLILAVVALVVLVAITPIGTALSTIFTNLTSAITGA